FGLSMSDLTTAIGQQNVQIAPGSLGALPALPGQRVTVPLTAQGQLATSEEFAKVVLRANADGSKVVLGDVARVELGSQNYTFVSRENNKPATLAGVQLAPGANAVKTADAIRARMAELSKSMPSGMSYSIPLDTSPFVKISIEKVLHTLLEAMVLVFL
ncbi:efflux RND transporter permease subunit, partial [Burkholderia cenocepacia]